MKETSRRRYLQAVGAGATGLVSATAGCSSLDGVLGSSGPNYRPKIGHRGWFDPEASNAVDEPNEVKGVSYWDSAAIREHRDSLADFLVDDSTGGELGLDAAVDHSVFTVSRRSVFFMAFADAGAGVEAAKSSDWFRPVPDVEAHQGTIREGTVAVVGDGVALAAAAPADSTASEADLLTAHARLLSNRPSSFEATNENLERLDTLVEAVGTTTIAQLFPSDYSGPDSLQALGHGFTVDSDRTAHRAVALGDIGPEAFKEYSLQFQSGYEAYEDLEATSEDGAAVLTGSVPTEEFDVLSRD